MSNQDKTVTSNVATLDDALVTPTQQAADVLKRVKAAKRIFAFVKIDVERAINKAKNFRNDASTKLYQAEDIAEAAKEDWKIKVIIASKKLRELQSNPEKKYLIKQLQQAKENAKQAKVNFENKKAEVAKKRLHLEQCQENLETAIKMQESRIKAAKTACKIALAKYKAIHYSA